MSLRCKTAALVLACLMAATVGWSQQVKKFRTATIASDTLDIDLKTNVWEFAGGCKLTVGGDYDATITAPAMTAQVASKPTRLQSVVTKGKTDFVVVTEPDNQGVQRRIVASAKEKAVYSEENQTIRMVGEAVADMMPVNGGDPDETVHLTGEAITANLKTMQLRVENVNLTVKTRLQ